MIDALSLPFMQRALIGGAIVGALASYYGTFVVQRRLSFLGNGLAHAAFGGVALGLLLHWEPLAVPVPFTIAVALGIDWVQRRTRLAGDTAIGIFFAVSMALGVIFLSLRKDNYTDAFTFLFGSILYVTRMDLALAGGMALLTAATIPIWRRWAYATFDRELALADRRPVAADDRLLAVALAVTIVVATKIVGLLLIAAFLVIPAAAARQLARTFFAMTLWSVAIGVASVVAGLMLSYQFDLPSGAVVILVQAGVFAASLLKRS